MRGNLGRAVFFFQLGLLLACLVWALVELLQQA